MKGPPHDRHRRGRRRLADGEGLRVAAARVVGVAGEGVAGGRRPGVGVVGVVGRRRQAQPAGAGHRTVAGVCGEPVYVKGPPSIVTVVVDAALPMVKVLRVAAARVVGVARKGIAGGRRPGVGVIGVVGRRCQVRPAGAGHRHRRGVSGEPV